jgi:hypothetical protein
MNDHKELVLHLNNQHLNRAQNAIMDEMEHKSAPLFWIVFLAATVVITWMVAIEHSDVEPISTLLAQCANGQIVPFDGGMMRCDIKPMVVMK